MGCWGCSTSFSRDVGQAFGIIGHVLDSGLTREFVFILTPSCRVDAVIDGVQSIGPAFIGAVQGVLVRGTWAALGAA